MNRIRSTLAVVAVLLFFLFSASSLSAKETQDSREDKEYKSAVQVSFFPPLSTNGLRSGRYTNTVSLNLLAGVSKNEKAFTLGGLVNAIGNDARGVQIGGLVNYVGNEGRGVQFGGLANINRRDFTGVQFGGLFNVARDTKGIQFGGLFNAAKEVHGLQFGGLFNVSRDIKGVQFGGLVNVAKRVRGVQFAGLVNVAEHSDCPIGLINIIKDGDMAVGVSYDELGTISLNFRSGGRVTYGILGVGYNHKVGRAEDAVAVLAGYGAHINVLPWLRINNEATIQQIDTIGKNNNTFKTGYSLLPTFRFFRHLEIFGGPSINYMQTGKESMYAIFRKNPIWERTNGMKKQQIYVGWQVGIQATF